MERAVLDQSLGLVATVTPDGRPNLAPEGSDRRSAGDTFDHALEVFRRRGYST